MAIVKKVPNKRPQIDLTGPQGNVYYLIGAAKRYANQLGLDGDEIAAEMMSSDYENAISVFEKYFGEYVDLLVGEI